MVLNLWFGFVWCLVIAVNCIPVFCCFGDWRYGLDV